MHDPAVINIENLCCEFGSATILKNLNFSIQKGEFVALIGENGAGKTTLIKHLNALLKPVNGRVEIMGQDTRHLKVSQLAKHVGYVFQNPDHQIFNLTVFDEVAWALKQMKLPDQEIRSQVNKALSLCDIDNLSAQCPFDLSRAQRQRVAIASVIAIQPEIIVLDEPTTGQDFRESIKIMDTFKDLNRENGSTVIFISHDLNLVARYAERTIMLSKGEILIDDVTENVFRQAELFAESLLELPPLYQLGHELQKLNILDSIPLKVDDFYLQLRDYYRKAGEKVV